MIDQAKKLLDNLFSFKPPEKEEEVISTLMNAFELMARDQKQEAPHGKLIRDLQKEKIGDLMFRIVEGYLPFIKGSDIIPVLKEFLMEAGHLLFFPVPRSVNSSDKMHLLFGLDKASDFLNLVEKRVEYMNRHELTVDTIDQHLLMMCHSIVKKVKSRKLFNPVETYFDRLCVALIAAILQKVVIKVFSPDTFLTLIDRFLDQPMDLNTLDPFEPSLEFFKINDPVFEEAFGQKLKELLLRVVGMGITQSSPLINWGMSFVTPKMLGETATQYFNRTLSSECSMKPILLAHHILLKDGKPTLPAASLPVSSIQVRMNNVIYPIIKERIDEKAGIIADWAAWLADLQPFLSTLGSNLDRIFKDPLTLKLLAHLVLKEVDAQVSL